MNYHYSLTLSFLTWKMFTNDAANENYPSLAWKHSASARLPWQRGDIRAPPTETVMFCTYTGTL